ncbi:MAG: hypothetical protein ABI726_03200 [bacterium]
MGAVGKPAALALAALAGVVTAFAVAPSSGAKGPLAPCVANPDATTITQRTYTGGNGAETIQADDRNNVIYGRGGNDVICAYRGKDRVYGGRGRDRLLGEDQNDRLAGGKGVDRLRGGDGSRDVCKGGGPSGPGPDPDTATDCETRRGASEG